MTSTDITWAMSGSICIHQFKLITPRSCKLCVCLDEDNARLNADLEDQYRHGLDMKMSGCARRHTGLGFSEPEPPPAASETSSEAGTDVVESADGDGDVGIPVVSAEEKCSEVQETDAKGQKDSSDTNTKPSDFKKPPMVGFVQSSAS